MFNRLNLTSRVAIVALAGLAFSVTAMAQDLPPAKLSLIAANGDTLDYTAGDASLYLSTTAAYEGVESTTDLSLSLSAVTPINDALLKWTAQTGGKSKDYAIVLTTTVSEEGGEAREMTYEIDGATVTSFSTSISTYAAPSISVSLSGGKLVMNGVPMN